jgi:hypothetical protein
MTRIPLVLAAAVVAALGALVVPAAQAAGVAQPAPAAGWARAVRLHLPSNAAAGTGGLLDGVACPTAVSCTVIGGYEGSTGKYLVMVDSLSAGRWGKASQVLLPANAAANPTATPHGIACSGAGSCVVVGTYYYGDGSRYADFVATQSRGRWSRARSIAPPSGAASPPSYQLIGVSCPAAGSCEAIGEYEVKNGSTELMAIAEQAGRWGKAVTVRPPGNGEQVPRVNYATGISCHLKGDCTAVGEYNDTSGRFQAFAVTESGGRWRQAAEISLPVGHAVSPAAVLRGVSCFTTTSCVAVGTYASTAGPFFGLAATESGGHWRQGVRISLAPADVAASTGLDKVACDSAGACTAVGGYYTGSYSGAAAVTLARGHWGATENITLPAGARTGTSSSAVLTAIACPSGCVGVGYYLTLTGIDLPMATIGPKP